MSNCKSTDPTIAELAANWSDCDLCDMYRRFRACQVDRGQWTVETIVAIDETVRDIVAELEQRGLGWVTGCVMV